MVPDTSHTCFWTSLGIAVVLEQIDLGQPVKNRPARGKGALRNEHQPDHLQRLKSLARITTDTPTRGEERQTVIRASETDYKL